MGTGVSTSSLMVVTPTSAADSTHDAPVIGTCVEMRSQRMLTDARSSELSLAACGTEEKAPTGRSSHDTTGIASCTRRFTTPSDEPVGMRSSFRCESSFLRVRIASTLGAEMGSLRIGRVARCRFRHVGSR